MQIRLLSLATVAALMLAPAAFAAPMTSTAGAMTSTGQCTALERQFDQIVGHHATAARYSAAKDLRADAGKLCATGKTSDGTAKLRTALHDIGVEPAV